MFLNVASDKLVRFNGKTLFPTRILNIFVHLNFKECSTKRFLHLGSFRIVLNGLLVAKDKHDSKINKRHNSAAIFSVDGGSELAQNELENLKKNEGIVGCEEARSQPSRYNLRRKLAFSKLIFSGTF